MANVNDMAAQTVASRMTGGPPQGAPGPPMGQPGMAGPPGGGGPQADPQKVQAGKQMLQHLTMLLTSDPNIMVALQGDIMAFGNVIKQFAGMAGGGGQPPAGGPPMGGPPMGGPAR